MDDRDPTDIAILQMAKTMTTAEIGEALGLASNTVVKRLIRHGERAVHPRDRKTAARDLQIIELKSSGMSVEQIARHVKAGEKTIRRAIRRINRDRAVQGKPLLRSAKGLSGLKFAAMRRDAERMIKDGSTLIAAARATGLSKNSLTKINAELQSARASTASGSVTLPRQFHAWR